MAKFKAVLFSMVLVLVSSVAFANGTWTNVTVSSFQPCAAAYCGGSGTVLVQFSSNVTGGPTCGNTNPAWVAIDVTATAGSFAASVLHSARLLGSTISVSGAGTCAIRTGYETLGWVLE